MPDSLIIHEPSLLKLKADRPIFGHAAITSALAHYRPTAASLRPVLAETL